MADVVESALNALLSAREQLEGYERDATGESYNDTQINAAIETLRARLSQAGAGGGVVDARQIAERVAGLVSLNKEAFAVEKAILDALAPQEPVRCRFDEINAAYLRGASWAACHADFTGGELAKAAYDYADKATPPATPVQPTASVEAVARIIAKWVDEERFADAPAFRMAAREIIASLTPAPTQGDGVRCTYCGDTGTITDRVDGEITCPECGYPSPAPVSAPAGGVRAVSDNGKRWRLIPADGDWEMQPTGHITARQAELLCKSIEAALSNAPGQEVVPVAWQRRWSFGAIDVMAIKRADRPHGWEFHEVTKAKIFPDDVPLYAHPTGEKEGRS